jgi:SNF2 family DNA or RNA helicase
LINPATITKFLARTLANFDWLKACTQPQLDADLQALSPAPDFGRVSLWLHQKASLLLLLELKRFMLFLDMGAGKTLITLMVLKYRKQRGEQPRAIVFVPYLTSVETWVEETAKHAPDLKCVALLGTTAENLSHLQGPGDLFVICYQSAVAMLAIKEAGKWQLAAKAVRDTFQGFDTLVLDEAHKCKSASSLTFRMCRAISAQADYVLGLTGTPFGRDLGDLWPQFYLVDFGETLGSTFGLYRSAFFTTKINYWGGYEYKFKKKLLPVLKSTMKNASISYTIDEFADMPPKEYIKRYLPLPDDASGYARKAIEELKSAIQGKLYRQAESSYLQLRQLASGFMTLRGEDNDKLQVQFEQNPKLEALEEILGGVHHGGKSIVFHHFVYSGALIGDRLTHLHIKHARIWGGQRDPIGELRRFKSDPGCTVLVINWKSGSSSLNLQNANYVVVFEQPESPIDRKQGEARVWRPGQGQRVLIYDLLMRGTVDKRLYEANESGRDLLQELLHGRQPDEIA